MCDCIDDIIRTNASNESRSADSDRLYFVLSWQLTQSHNVPHRLSVAEVGTLPVSEGHFNVIEQLVHHDPKDTPDITHATGTFISFDRHNIE